MKIEAGYVQSKFFYIVLFLLDYGVLVLHHLKGDSLPFEVIAKIVLLCLFWVVIIKDEVWALVLFLGTSIVLGYNGELHRFPGGIPISIYFLVFLCFRMAVFSQQRSYLWKRMQQSSFLLYVVLTGMVVPAIGILGGLVHHNNRTYLLKDADSWFFYLFFFCCLALIRNQARFIFLMQSFFTAIFISALLNTVISCVYIYQILSVDNISHLYYQVLNLGGLLMFKTSGALRIYTGNVIFLPIAICLVVLMLILKRRLSFLIWFLIFLILVQSLITSYTRAFWLSSFLSMVLLVFFLPSAQLKKEFLAACFSFCMIFTIILNFVRISPFQVIKSELNRISESIAMFKEGFEAGQSNPQFSDGGDSTAIKLKQYLALFDHTRKKLAFGHGFGATLPGQKTYRLEKDMYPFVFEAGYGDLFMKVGVIGFCLWFSLLGALGIKWIVLYHTSKFNTRLILIVFGLPLIGLLFAFATNPYIYTPFGILTLVVTTFVLDQISLFNQQGQSEQINILFESFYGKVVKKGNVCE
ncbi:hypothetical protein ACFL27_00140 [candidate division CSSED10-310 bacterium]|uniref:O-antigen ligase domain-containing protein n=1 Tax=candidate division CSSED10-310 bacterium TaxID=2855610 RepID=A0ABV6YQV8_UNCC1